MQANLLSRFSHTVETIYAAAMKFDLWPEAVRQIALLQGADKAAVLTPSTPLREGGFILRFNIDDSELQQWSTDYIHHDPWIAAAQRRAVIRDGHAMLGEDLVPDSQLVQTLFYREFLSRVGVRRLCTGIVFDGSVRELPITTCSTYAGENGTVFDQTHVEVHTHLLRHLSCALGTMYKLRDLEFRSAASIQALDCLPSAVLIVGDRGHVIHVNRAALHLLDHSDAIFLRAGHPVNDGLGWLRTADPGSQRVLDIALQRAVSNDFLLTPAFTDALAIQGPGGSSRLVLRTAPLSEAAEFPGRPPRAAALVFITEQAAVPVLDLRALRGLYRITQAEAKVAQTLVQGGSVTDLAKGLGLSEATVRTHLRRLFEKTQTSRQSELLRLLLDLRLSP